MRELLRPPGDVPSEVLRVLLERARSGSVPGRRTDGHVVCLAVEGGGMRGAVTAGMGVLLEAAGLAAAFDRVYGVSAGALNAAALAAGQAAMSSTHYQDAATRRVVNPARPLRGRPVVDLDFVFGELIGRRKPLSLARMASGPAFGAIATSLEDGGVRVLRDFADAGELVHALRTSASLPALGGSPPVFRGERMIDGGVAEPLPFTTAIREGATHVLVLRSRPAGYRRPRYGDLAARLALRRSPEIARLLAEHAGTYNRQADELAELSKRPDAAVMQIAVADGTALIRRLETSGEGVIEALRLGAAACAGAVLTEPVDLCWQPVARRAAPALDPAPAPAPAQVLGGLAPALATAAGPAGRA
jgi:predicted patatin/cPLA2 family phospholipase